MSAVFGIHFGSTNSCISVIKDGQPQVLTNDIGDRITPCIVAYNEGDIGVGIPARQNMIRNLHNTVLNVKQLLGRSFPEVTHYVEHNEVKVINVKDEPMVVMRGEGGSNKQFSATYIATCVFKKLMETAKAHSTKDAYKVVLSTPSYFTQQQKEAIVQSAKQAGFSILRLIHQSASPILAYQLLTDATLPPCTVMVVRIGGTSSDVNILRIASGMCAGIACVKDESLGGGVIDNLIVNLLASEFKRKSKMDCRGNKRSMFKLLQAAEECKKILSNASTSTSSCHVESLFEGLDFSHPLSRLRLEGLSGPFVNSVLSLCKSVVSEGMVVDKIIMVGGVANTPCLVKKLQNAFPATSLLSHIPPEEVIAIGNAMQAMILTGSKGVLTDTSVKQVTMPCLSKDILIQTGDGPQLLFAKGTAVPFKKQVHLKLISAQQSVVIKVFQRSSHAERTSDAGDNHVVENGDVTPLSPLLSMALPCIDESNTIDAIFHFRHDGSLHLTCSSGDEKSDLVVEAASIGLVEAVGNIVL